MRTIFLIAATAACLVPASSALAGTTALVDRLAIDRDGKPYFADSFTTSGPPLNAPSLADGTPVEYQAGGKLGHGAEGGGKLRLNADEGAYNPTPDGQGRRTVFVRLLTNGDNAKDTAGLKRAVAFEARALFDFVAPEKPIDGYGLRLTNLGAPDETPQIVNLFLFRDQAGRLVLRLLEQNFQAHVQNIVVDAPFAAQPGQQVELRLTHPAAGSPDIVASYQLFSGGQPAGEPVEVGTSSILFEKRNWARPELFIFEKADKPGG